MRQYSRGIVTLSCYSARCVAVYTRRNIIIRRNHVSVLRAAIVSVRYTYVSFMSNLYPLLPLKCVSLPYQFRKTRKRSFIPETLTRSCATFLKCKSRRRTSERFSRREFLSSLFQLSPLFESLITLMYVIIRLSFVSLWEDRDERSASWS